jgi:hypothetical protein
MQWATMGPDDGASGAKNMLAGGWGLPMGCREHSIPVCEIIFWRYATPLFTVTYEPFWKGD